MKSIKVGDFDHEVGNKECKHCWSGFPMKHKDCGGLMHAEFGDENYDMDYWLYYKCDKCNSEDAN